MLARDKESTKLRRDESTEFTRNESTEKLTDEIIKYLSSMHEIDPQIFHALVTTNGRLFFNMNINDIVISGGHDLHLMDVNNIVNDIVTSGGCDLHLINVNDTPTSDGRSGFHLMLAILTPDRIKNFKNSYILMEKQLYYIKHDGTPDEVLIKNPDQFIDELHTIINDTKETLIRLTDYQVYKLITSNGGHQPSGSQVETFKLCPQLLKEYHDAISQINPVVSEYTISQAHNIRESIIRTCMRTKNWETFWETITRDIPTQLQPQLEIFFSSAICFILNGAITESSNEYSFCLMSKLPQADQEQKNTSIITPQGLYQLNEKNNEYKRILASKELKQMEFDSFLKRAKKQKDKKTSIKHELTLDQLRKLNEKVISKGGHSLLGKLNLSPISTETNKLVLAIHDNEPDVFQCLTNLREQYSAQLFWDRFSTRFIFNNINNNNENDLRKLMGENNRDLLALPKNPAFILLGKEYAISATLDHFDVFLKEILHYETGNRKHNKLKNMALEFACDSALQFINSQKETIYGKSKSHENARNNKLCDNAKPVLSIALKHASNKAKTQCSHIKVLKAEVPKNWKPESHAEISHSNGFYDSGIQPLTPEHKSRSSLLGLFSKFPGKKRSSSMDNTEPDEVEGIIPEYTGSRSHGDETPQHLTAENKTNSEPTVVRQPFLLRTASLIFKPSDRVQKSVSQPALQKTSPPTARKQQP